MKLCLNHHQFSCLFLTLFVSTSFHSVFAGEPKHYVFFGFDRELIEAEKFLESTVFAGAQLKYSWRELEPQRDQYDFSAIEHDLDTLRKANKGLFVQLQEVSFSPNIYNVPRYLREDEEFNGGADLDYWVGTDSSKPKPSGHVARRWDPPVQERMHKLFSALGSAFDGKIEGISLPETSVGFGETGLPLPEGFTPERYETTAIENMIALKEAFPKSVVLQYANFMPGDWMDGKEAPHLESVFNAARKHGIGVGGPDIKVKKRWQMFNSYPLIRAASETVPTGVAVQWGNYAETNPDTGERVTIEEIHQFATDYLNLDYIFWGTQPPYFEHEVIPFLERVGKAHP